MRKQLLLGVVTALGLCSSSAWAATTNYTATLDGVLATPESNATGTAAFTFDDVTKRLCGKITYTGLSGNPTAIKLQTSQDDLGFDITPTPKPTASPVLLSATLNQTQEDALAGGDYIINLLTATHPNANNGELNGILEEGGDAVACPAVADAGTDAGKDASTSTPSSPSTSGGSDTTGSGSTTSDTPDAGTKKAADSGGCATVGDSNAASGLGLATIAGMGVALVLRGRRRRR